MKAISPILSYERSIEYEVGDVVYPSAATARRALQDAEGHAKQSCLSRAFSQQRYLSGTVALSAPKAVKAGNAAFALQITVPVDYRGSRYVEYSDSIFTVQGRVLAAIATVTTSGVTNKSMFAYDVGLARAFAADAQREQAYLRG